jgi:hypothetical protein
MLNSHFWAVCWRSISRLIEDGERKKSSNSQSDRSQPHSKLCKLTPTILWGVVLSHLANVQLARRTEKLAGSYRATPSEIESTADSHSFFARSTIVNSSSIDKSPIQSRFHKYCTTLSTSFVLRVFAGSL